VFEIGPTSTVITVLKLTYLSQPYVVFVLMNTVKKKKTPKNPIYLPTVKNMSRVTANIQFFKDGLIYIHTLSHR
jgi:hypothetical protein